MWSFRAWRRRRYLRQTPWPKQTWRRLCANLPLLGHLAPDDVALLRDLALLFLHEKTISGGADYVPDDEVALAIAAQACLPVLHLGFDYLDGWRGVIVYPGEFAPEREVVDEAGVVHVGRHPLLGEAWRHGPILLAADEVMQSGAIDGVNVVIHEIAHKIDMLNGESNGFPPLHSDMSHGAWTATFTAAYDDFCAHVNRDEASAPFDPYGAEDPAEFFSVMSEAFFEIPHALARVYPAVYAQLAAFYRQEPRLRAQR